MWDNSTRAELLEFLEEQRQSRQLSEDADLEGGVQFSFSSHKEELVIGGVYIRIYNQQPTFTIEVNIRNPAFN